MSNSTITPPAGANDTADGDDDLITRAAAGAELSPKETRDLLDYYLTNGGLPGDQEPSPVEWTIGEGTRAVKNVWHFHRLAWEDWQDAQERATNKETGEYSAFVQASYVVARGLVKPVLGPKVLKQQAEAKDSADGKIAGPRDDDGNPTRIDPPVDAAHLLRRMFFKQAGVLLELAGDVLQISKLLRDNQTTRNLDREIDAAKT